ncbi:YbfB/YjiJ family MFS transporter [Ramlibacter sp. PS3R-8]|uniref:YbfB/YjiJ family MFS transporter n=1 Tax=Ramlibacter sp. PS3R-8 TaxID=3133437 RepID=UPI00309938AB
MSVPSPSPRPIAIALAGLVALAVAMGIGRFAFTPLLPLMLAERSLTLAGASLLASANYLGYLLGALACTFQPWLWRRFGWSAVVNGPRLVRIGLAVTALLTLAMAADWTAAWTLLRFAAGVASAVVFLYTSGWCLEQLARRGVPSMGALIFVGPGAGIVASGLAATVLVQWGALAAVGWFTFGVLAVVLTALVWRVFHVRNGIAAPVAGTSGVAAAPPALPAGGIEMGLLATAYGLAGIGYIITATFLPVIARQALPESHWLDLFWPLFGAGVMVGALGASRLPPSGDMRVRLAICYAMQAAGVCAGLVSPTLAGFAIGSLLLGLPFTAITFFGLQEVRRLRPQQATSFMGLLTMVYGAGQIAGPPLAAWLVARSATPAAGFNLSLWIATALLVFGALLYLALARRFPMLRGLSGPRPAAPARRG